MPTRKEIEDNLGEYLTLEDINTLSEWQPGLMEDLAERYGETAEEYRQSLANGLLPTIHEYFLVANCNR